MTSSWATMGNEVFLLSLFLCSSVFTLVRPFGEFEEMMESMSTAEVARYRTREELQTTQREVEFILYKNGAKRGAATKVDAAGPIHMGALSPHASLKVCIHGWKNDVLSEFIVDFVKIFTQKKKGAQVVAVSWKGAKLDYIGSRRLIDHVANQTFTYFKRLEKDLKVDLGKVTVVGHGLGAQIAGAAGHLLRGKLGRIIALDPSEPLFWPNTHDTVNISSAKTVVGLHTSSGYAGAYWNFGRSDFWANGGSVPQPGCYQGDLQRTISCSHDKAFRYYLESINNPKAFKAVQCGVDFICSTPEQKSKLKTDFFREKTKAEGQYCFKTNPIAPYSLESVHNSSEED